MKTIDLFPTTFIILTDGDKTVTFPSNRKTTTKIFVTAIQISEMNFKSAVFSLRTNNFMTI